MMQELKSHNQEHNETINYSNLRLVLGEEADGSSEAFHPCLRNFGES